LLDKNIAKIMAKRGRKPKEKKGYFYETEEQAIVQYLNETDIDEKNKLFNTVLYPALTKMIESIIRRYKLFVPDEDFDQNFNDTISYLLTKISHFKPQITGYTLIDNEKDIKKHSFEIMSEEDLKSKIRNAKDSDPEYVVVYYGIDDEYCDDIEKKYFKKETHNYKAYSYCGTVCKNYLMYKSSQYTKKKMRNTSYDEIFEEISNSTKFSTIDVDYGEIAEKLVTEIADEIEKMVLNYNAHMLTENEIKVGNALVELLRNWEEVLPNGGSNKLQKSSVLYFLREETMMSTKEVRDNMKKYKCIYKLLKKMAIE
jgi:hypothetical protein